MLCLLLPRTHIHLAQPTPALCALRLRLRAMDAGAAQPGGGSGQPAAGPPHATPLQQAMAAWKAADALYFAKREEVKLAQGLSSKERLEEDAEVLHEARTQAMKEYFRLAKDSAGEQRGGSVSNPPPGAAGTIAVQARLPRAIHARTHPVPRRRALPARPAHRTGRAVGGDGGGHSGGGDGGGHGEGSGSGGGDASVEIVSVRPGVGWGGHGVQRGWGLLCTCAAALHMLIGCCVRNMRVSVVSRGCSTFTFPLGLLLPPSPPACPPPLPAPRPVWLMLATVAARRAPGVRDPALVGPPKFWRP